MNAIVPPFAAFDMPVSPCEVHGLAAKASVGSSGEASACCSVCSGGSLGEEGQVVRSCEEPEAELSSASSWGTVSTARVDAEVLCPCTPEVPGLSPSLSLGTFLGGFEGRVEASWKSLSS